MMEFHDEGVVMTRNIDQDPSPDDLSWNPMQAEFQSVMNFGFANIYLTSALIVGGIHAEGAYSSIREVPCEFHDGRGKCRKGRHCVKYHPINGKEPSTRPAALQKSVNYASMMPTGLKDLPARGTQFLGKICHIISPLEFYIIPTIGSACLCGCGDGSKKYNQGHFEPITGMQLVKDVDKDINLFMDAKKRTYQVPEYEHGQLVAVKIQVALMGMPQTHQLRWFRGIVEEKVVYDKKNPYATPPVKVLLVDFGSKVVVPLHEIAALPLRFVYAAPSAFKCELDGLIPVGATFSSEAIAYFKSIVMNKEVIVEFKSRREDEKTTENKNSYCDLNLTYSVDLSLKDLTQVGIGQLLNQKGYGILAHPFPRRPWIIKNYPFSVAGANWSQLPNTHPPELAHHIMEDETQRIFNVITRQDGYFESRVGETADVPIFIKFPEEYGKRGVPVLPQLKDELPQIVISLDPVPYVPAVDESPSDQDTDGSLEMFQNRST